MATTTRRVLRQRVSEAMGDYQSLSTTSLGTSTTLIATGFKDLPGGNDDDAFAGFYDYITSGNNENEARRATPTGFAQSTNTLTTSRAHTNAVASGVTLELHRYDPADYLVAIRQAISEAYPALYLPIRDETLVVDDRLTNSDFESAISAGAHPSWTNVGAGITVTAETSILMHGTQSNKLVAGAGAAGQTTQAPTLNIQEVTGKSATFKCWVYATAANIARIRLDWDGTAIDSHAYHSGRDEWSLQTLTGTVPSTATQVKVICEVAAGGTAYFDASRLLITPLYRYTIPAALLKGPHYVSQQADESDLTGRYYPIWQENPPLRGSRLRLEGMGLLTNPASDTATIEIGAPQTDLLVAYAARNMNRILASRAAGQQMERYLAEAARWEREAQVLQSRPGIAMPRLGAMKPRGVFHIEENAVDRFLVLDQKR